MAQPEWDRISIHTNGIQMDLYISSKGNLHSKPSYPNASNSGWQLCYLIFFCQSKELCPSSGSSDDHRPGGTLGVKHAATVGSHGRDFNRRNAGTFKTHFISWSNRLAAEVKYENKCWHRKAQRKRSVTLFPNQKQEQQDGWAFEERRVNGQFMVQGCKVIAACGNANNQQLHQRPQP